MGQNLTDEGAAVSQGVPVQGSESARTYNWNTRVKNGEVMLVARLLWKISGNPGYGEGDIQYSRKPQTALAVGYAYNPGVNVLSSIRSNMVARGLAQGTMARVGNGRYLGGGIYDSETWELDFVHKYHGWAFQAKAVPHQKVRDNHGSRKPGLRFPTK